jgi:dihydrodipicolinate synthase/N-acetylneuraminate lyase
VKSALASRGLPVKPDVRAPLAPLSASAAASLRTELELVLGSLEALPRV